MVLARTNARLFDFDRATRDEIALFLARAAVAAGPAVVEVYDQEVSAKTKGDGSPVTLADLRAEAIVCDCLADAVPPVPIVAEESASAGNPITASDRFLLIDPLDGTREFLSRNGEFTINVALVGGRRPIAGAVYAPAIGRLWFGGDRSFVCDAPVGGGLLEGAMHRPIRARIAPEALTVMESRSHSDPQTDAFLKTLPVAERRSKGSSLKFCLIAEGLADVYPRFGPTMEWDTAAGDAVLRAAGGVVFDLSGAPLAYGKFDKKLRNGAFTAWGDPDGARRFGVR
jgi:3'(2'),5'-bisphosphate nucleotidase